MKRTVLILLPLILIFSCKDIALKETIDEMVLGWTREVSVVSPDDGEGIADKTPLLDWEDAGGATGYEVQIVVAEDRFESTESVEVTESEYEIPYEMILGTERYWRVRAVSNGSTGEWSNVRSFKILPSTTPELVKTIDLGVHAWGMEVSGNYLYASAGENGIKVFDISSPSAPELIDTVPTANGVWDINISGNYAYVSESFAETNPYYVYILDISDPSSVSVKDSYGINNQCYGLLYGGTSLYVGCWDGYYRFDNILSTFDSAPERINPAGLGKRINSFDTYGSYLVYTVDDTGIRILQINGNVDVGSAAADFQTDWDNSMVTVYDHYAYTTSMNTNSIEIFDIEDVTNPVSAADYSLSAGGNNISITNRFAFVSLFNGSVLILDITDPESPQEWGTIPAEEAVISVNSVSGNYLYGTEYSTGKLHVVDLIPGD